VIEMAGEKFGLDAEPFRRLLDLREQKTRSKDVEPEALLAAYMREIGKVIDAVDSLEKVPVQGD
jgi:uncharacterized protein (UPF0335 family)